MAADANQELLLKISGDVSDATDAIKGLSGQFTGLGDVLASLTSPTALVTTAIGLLVAAAIDVVDAFQKDAEAATNLAFQTGLTTQAADALTKTMLVAGASPEYLQTAMQRLSLELANGGKNVQDIGVNLRDLDGNLKTEGDVFIDTIDKLAAMSNAQERNAEMLKIFGRGASELIPVVEQWNNGLRDTYTNLQQTSVMTEEATKAAQKQRMEIALLKETWTGFKDMLGSVVSGAGSGLAYVIKGFNDLTTILEGVDLKTKQAGDAQVVMANKIVAAAEEQFKASTKTITVQQEVIKAAKDNAELMAKLHADELENLGYTEEAMLAKVDYELAQEKAKIILQSKFKDEQNIKDMAGRNKVAAQYLALLNELEADAAAKRVKINADAELKEAQNEVEQLNKNRADMDKGLADYEKMQKEMMAFSDKTDKKIAEDQKKTVNDILKEWTSMADGIITSFGNILTTHKSMTKTLQEDAAEAVKSMLETFLKGEIKKVISTEFSGVAAAWAEAPSTFGASLAYIPTILASAATALGNMVGLAEGGVVTSPMMAMIGEAGPEAVIPLDQAGSSGYGGGGITINISTLGATTNQQARQLAEIVGQALQSKLRSLRLNL